MILQCKGCPKRFVGCHSSCGEYKAFREEKNRQNAKDRIQIKANQDIYALKRKTSVIKRVKTK